MIASHNMSFPHAARAVRPKPFLTRPFFADILAISAPHSTCRKASGGVIFFREVAHAG